MSSDYGLTSGQLELIKEILAPFAVCLDRVVLFGSRSSDNYRTNSDIDLALYGPVDTKVVSRLLTLFMESSLPVTVDLVSYHSITSEALKKHIDLVGLTLFTKEDLMG
jgi:predicted nucleotidyltransferase